MNKLFDPARFPELLWSACRQPIIKSLEIAGAALANELRERISVQGPPPSMPGHPPHVDSGYLIDHIWWEVDEKNLVVYVMADTIYAYYLEYGTSKMAPRPFLRSSVPEIVRTQASRWVTMAVAHPRGAVDDSRHYRL